MGSGKCIGASVRGVDCGCWPGKVAAMAARILRSLAAGRAASARSTLDALAFFQLSWKTCFKVIQQTINFFLIVLSS